MIPHIGDVVATSPTKGSYYEFKIGNRSPTGGALRTGPIVGKVVSEVTDLPGFWWVQADRSHREIFHEHELQAADVRAAESRNRFLAAREMAKPAGFASHPFDADMILAIQDSSPTRELKFSKSRDMPAQGPFSGDMSDAARYAFLGVGAAFAADDRDRPRSADSLRSYAQRDTLGALSVHDELERSVRAFSKGNTPLTYEEAWEMKEEAKRQAREQGRPIAVATQGGRPAIKAQMNEMKKTRRTASGLGLGGGGDVERENGTRIRRRQLPRGENVIQETAPMGVELRELEDRLSALLARHAESGRVPEVRLPEGTARQVSRAIRKYVVDIGEDMARDVRSGLLKLSVAFEQADLFQISS